LPDLFFQELETGEPRESLACFIFFVQNNFPDSCLVFQALRVKFFSNKPSWAFLACFLKTVSHFFNTASNGGFFNPDIHTNHI